MELDPLKILAENLVRTGFMTKYNYLVDKVIYKVELDGNNLVFYTNIGTTTIPMTSNIADLLDVDLTSLVAGQILTYDGTKWINIDFDPSDIDYVRSDVSTRSGFSDVSNITSITNALDQILYPYKYPTFASFTIGSKSNTLELGEALIPIGGESVSFVWSVNEINNVSTTTGYKIEDTTFATTLDTNILPKTTTNKTVNIPSVIAKYSNNATHIFKITGTNTKVPETTFNISKTYTWIPRRFWGTSSNGGALSSSEIIGLASTNTGGSELSGYRQQIKTMSGNSQYIHFYWDSSLGDTSQILVGNLPNSAWNKHSVSFTNAHGYTTNYTGYVTHNPAFGTGIKIEIT